MTDVVYGATRQEWEAFASLNLRDLLPTVTDPRVRVSARSKLQGPSTKVPSFVNAQGEMQGFIGWPTKVTTSVHDWWGDNRLGICMIARTIRAIDIDVGDVAEAEKLEAFIRVELGMAGLSMPVRTRSNSGKRLLIYRLADVPEGGLTKTKVRVNGKGEVIEFLHDGQQFLVAGMHPTGVRYEWPDGIPTSIEDVPVIELHELIDLHRALQAYCEAGADKGEWTFDGRTMTAVSRHKGQIDYSNDPIVQYLYAHDWVKDMASDGGILVRCPWEREHTSETNISEAKFFPVGLGGIDSHPGFRCMHAHCLNRTHQAFLTEIGYEDLAFEEVEETAESHVESRPKFTYKGKSNQIEATLTNITLMARWRAGFGYDVRYDQFKDVTVYRFMEGKWNPLTDDTYTEMRLRMAACGMDPFVSKEAVRDAISLVAREHTVDTAREWLEAQRWDGIPRLAQFHVDALNLEDTPYHRAVVLYLWTALAGRIMQPGVKADMVPILIGKQGKRKSTLVEAIAPTADEFASVSLADRDADLARVLRGKMVVEWGEMRGLDSRDAEGIKDWVSRTKDDWIPKFKEFGTTMLRRFLLIGTTNNRRCLNDPTGMRRWLPLFITSSIDTTYVRNLRSQLWAEARELFKQEGVLWQDAEELAVDAQRLAAVRDIWVDPVINWLKDQNWRDGWTTNQILHGACGVATAYASRSHQERLRRVMVFLSWEEDDAGRWHCSLA